ncbi:MAG: PIN domain-containing protein [Chthoniobacterales bacterium]
MTARCFADTNVFLYAASKAPEDCGKRQVARALLASEDVGISAQVLQEFFAVAAGKKRLGLSEAEALQIVTVMMEFPVLPVTGELVQEAIALKLRHGISYWDAAILAAAHELGCELLYSEDLNAGQDYSGVLVQNPFAKP